MSEFNERPNEGSNDKEFNFDFDLSKHFQSQEPLNVEETVATARAMAEREGRDSALTSKTIAELSGKEYQSGTPDENNKTLLLRTSTNMSKIKNPFAKIDPREALRSSFGATAYRELAERLMTDDMNDIDNLLSTTSETEREPEVEQRRNENFAKELEAAKLIANNRGVNVSEVYSNDDLHSEAIRESYTPETFANKYIHTANSFGRNLEKGLTLESIEQLMPKGTRESMTEREFNRLLIGLRSQLSAEADEMIEIGQETARQIFVCRATQHWGDGVLEQITDEQREIITPKQPLAFSVIEELNKD